MTTVPIQRQTIPAYRPYVRLTGEALAQKRTYYQGVLRNPHASEEEKLLAHSVLQSVAAEEAARRLESVASA